MWGYSNAYIELMCTDTTIYPSLSGKLEKHGASKRDAEESKKIYDEKKKKGLNYKTVNLSEMGIKI